MNKRICTTILVFLVLAIHSDGQRIIGTVYDKENMQAVDFAAVYINGTTIGTITDSLGNFLLEADHWPGELVVSHINYKLTLVNTHEGDSVLKVPLERKYYELSEVATKNQNKRADNLAYFRALFLGSDIWGQNAKILNDSVLRFEIEYPEPDEDSTLIFYRLRWDKFKVSASQALIISLPQLGYTLRYDLITFEEKRDTVVDMYMIKSEGRYYYIPEEGMSRMKMNTFARNRKKAYYNSRQHFLKSLYSEELEENGYLVFERIIKSWPDSVFSTTELNLFDFKACNCLLRSKDELVLLGLANKEFIVSYHGTEKKPFDLTRARYLGSPVNSMMIILNDECLVREDGTSLSGMVAFSTRMGDKRIGASLPSNYTPGDFDAEKEQRKRKNMHETLQGKGRL